VAINKKKKWVSLIITPPGAVFSFSLSSLALAFLVVRLIPVRNDGLAYSSLTQRSARVIVFMIHPCPLLDYPTKQKSARPETQRRGFRLVCQRQFLLPVGF
jgi:hypothetical protein